MGLDNTQHCEEMHCLFPQARASMCGFRNKQWRITLFSSVYIGSHFHHDIKVPFW